MGQVWGVLADSRKNATLRRDLTCDFGLSANGVEGVKRHRKGTTSAMGVADDHRLTVSGRLRADFDNGKTYYAMQGKQLVMPKAVPDAEALEWHREAVFLG